MSRLLVSLPVAQAPSSSGLGHRLFTPATRVRIPLGSFLKAFCHIGLLMINGEIVAAFNRIADLMEISGESGFRVNSYRRAARTIKAHPEDLAIVAEEGRLTDLDGVGKSSAEKIVEYIEQGSIGVLDKLEKKLPASLPDLLEIQGLGPKKIAVLHEELGIGSLDDLKAAIEAGSVAELAGFGAQSVNRISEGIAFLEKSGGRTPLGIAWPIADEMADRLRVLAGVERVEIAGSLRRGAETIGDVDLLCVCDDAEPVMEAFTSQDGVQRVLARGSTKSSVTVAIDAGRELQVDLRVVPAESFGAALQYFTGSKEHNVRVRELAVRRKLRLNEYGLYDGDDAIAGETEEGIYEALELPFFPPEIREDRGELDVIEPPELITVDDIRGDLHMHTVASDGKGTIEEMAAAAKKRGYDYIAITDHSKSSVVANGLSIERMKQHIKDIRAVDKKVKGIRILVGCECDILMDGSLDYPDDILADCDVVVASIHTGMTGAKSKPTDRLLRAIDNKYVTIIGHTTGRLINRRPAMEIDMAKVMSAAAANDTAMEINASWQRLDLKDLHVRQAIEAGVMLTIDTDSHHMSQLDQMRYGIKTARRGWATADHVLNTQTTAKLLKWVSRKRG